LSDESEDRFGKYVLGVGDRTLSRIDFILYKEAFKKRKYISTFSLYHLRSGSFGLCIGLSVPSIINSRLGAFFKISSKLLTLRAEQKTKKQGWKAQDCAKKANRTGCLYAVCHVMSFWYDDK